MKELKILFDNNKILSKNAKRIIEEGSAIFETKHKTKSGEIINIITSSVAIQLNGRYYTNDTNSI